MMINNFILNIKSEDQSNGPNMMLHQPQIFQNENQKSYEVLDLSRRRDSVETRKTLSPYNSSSFGEGSPSTIHESPRAPSPSTGVTNTHSETSPRHFSTPPASHFNRYSPPMYAVPYPSPPKRESTTPPSASNQIFVKRPHHEHPDDINPYMLQAIQRQINPPTHESTSPPVQHNFYPKPSSATDRQSISPYMMQAAALQQQLSQNPLNHTAVESDDSSEANLYNSNFAYNNTVYPMVVGRDGKLTRPFKAYPRDPLSITASFTASDSLMDSQSAEKYQIFRKEMLKQIRAANGGQPTLSNPKMRRTSIKSQEGQSLDGETSNDSNNNQNQNTDNINGCVKDSAYYERRKKNNAAAKKSRDRRRIKEDEIAIRANFLERENIELKFELAAARKQLSLYGVKT